MSMGTTKRINKARSESILRELRDNTPYLAMISGNDRRVWLESYMPEEQAPFLGDLIAWQRPTRSLPFKGIDWVIMAAYMQSSHVDDAQKAFDNLCDQHDLNPRDQIVAYAAFIALVELSRAASVLSAKRKNLAYVRFFRCVAQAVRAGVPFIAIIFAMAPGGTTAAVPLSWTAVVREAPQWLQSAAVVASTALLAIRAFMLSDLFYAVLTELQAYRQAMIAQMEASHAPEDKQVPEPEHACLNKRTYQP